MKSIQGRLIFAITAASVILLTATGIFFYQSTQFHLIRQFDGSLEAQASAVSSFVNLRVDGKYDFDYSATALSEFRRSPHAQYFVIRFDDGRVFAKSDSLKEGPPLQTANAAHAQDIRLPTGRIGRAIGLTFIPPFDPYGVLNGKPPPVAQPMTIEVARDRAVLDSSLHDFLWRLIAGMGMLAICNVIAVVVVVRRSLRPLHTLTNCTKEIGPDQLHRRLPTTGLPVELSPISLCLNDLLERIDQAFARERRFTSDVAHELRTPIAELRAARGSCE